MLYGKILRSPLPHATIKKIETAAEQLPGVVAVLTRDDLQGHQSLLRPLDQRPGHFSDRQGALRRRSGGGGGGRNSERLPKRPSN